MRQRSRVRLPSHATAPTRGSICRLLPLVRAGTFRRFAGGQASHRTPASADAIVEEPCGRAVLDGASRRGAAEGEFIGPAPRRAAGSRYCPGAQRPPPSGHRREPRGRELGPRSTRGCLQAQGCLDAPGAGVPQARPRRPLACCLLRGPRFRLPNDCAGDRIVLRPGAFALTHRLCCPLQGRLRPRRQRFLTPRRADPRKRQHLCGLPHFVLHSRKFTVDREDDETSWHLSMYGNLSQ